jgi:hypothetical protein
MSSESTAASSTCDLVQFRVRSAKFLHIEPRPRADAPADLEQRLLERVKEELESEHHACGAGCECVIGEPVEVASREHIKKVQDGAFTAWYEVVLVKYRTQGECMPASDELPG